MVIDLSDTSLPASTDFNSLIQQLAEKVFPNAFYLIRNGQFENGASFSNTQNTVNRTYADGYSIFQGAANNTYNGCKIRFDGNVSDYTTLVVEGYGDTDSMKIGLSTSTGPTYDNISNYITLSATLATESLQVGGAISIGIAMYNNRVYRIKNMYLQ